MIKTMLVIPVVGAIAAAQVVVPDGTKVRVRLDQTLSSATADEGQTVELSVTDAIVLDGVTVVPEGARGTGTVVIAQEKRRMGRAGKLDFSVDRVRAVNGQWLPVRYTLTKKEGDGKSVSTGVITAGVAVVFWPAAPFVLLRKGKDTAVNKGVTFDVFIDGNHTIGAPGAPPRITSAQPTSAVPPVTAASPAPMAQAPPDPARQASITIASSEPGADIEVNGGFVGNTPTVLKLEPGQYAVTVRSGAKVWQRTLQVNAGSTVTLNAVFESAPLAQRRP
jgi:hypothetical protein